MGKKLLVCVILMSLCVAAQAKNQCTEKDLVVDETQWNDFSGFVWTLPLPSYSSVHGKYKTGAVADFVGAMDSMSLKFRFDLPEDMVANPYNIYRIEFDVGEGADLYHYEIGDCNGAIGSFWPMDPFKIYPIYLNRHSDGSPRGVEPVHVRIWGHQ